MRFSVDINKKSTEKRGLSTDLTPYAISQSDSPCGEQESLIGKIAEDGAAYLALPITDPISRNRMRKHQSKSTACQCAIAQPAMIFDSNGGAHLGMLNRTPGPPPFSSMNSTPAPFRAFSMVFRLLEIGERDAVFAKRRRTASRLARLSPTVNA